MHLLYLTRKSVKNQNATADPWQKSNLLLCNSGAALAVTNLYKKEKNR
jgi:hypothetical protein